MLEFSLQDVDGPITIPVRWMNKDQCFVLDTGSTETVLDETWFSQLKADGSFHVDTAAGPKEMPSVDAPDLKVGSFNLRDCGRVVRTDLASIRIASGLPVIGIIGISAMRNKVVQIDFDSKKLRLMAPDDPPRPEWGTAIPMELVKRRPTIQVNIAGESEPLLIDTGCVRYCFLGPKLFEHVCAESSGRVATMNTSIMGGTTSMRIVRAPAFQVAGRDYHDLLFLEDKLSGSAGALGTGFLSRHLVTMDFPRKRLYLKPGKAFDLRQEWCMSGMGVLRVAGNVLATEIDHGGPAEQCGIQEGDILLEIGGRPTNEFSLYEIERLFRSAEGRVVTVKYRHGNTESVAHITLKRVM